MTSGPSQYTPRLVTAADGTNIGVHEVEGTGSLIVALHGFTGSGSTMIPLLDAIRDGRPALAVDLVGHGQSDAPEYLDSYSMPSVVDQVLSLIGPRNPGTVHLVGYSMGGRIALSMAARAPWYFASITTLSSSPGIDDPAERAKRHDSDLALADRLVEVGVAAFIDEWLTTPLFASYVASLDDDGRRATVSARLRNSATGLANSLRGTGTGAMAPVWTPLGSLHSPLLALAGELDSKFATIAHEMADIALFGTASIVADAGHVLHEENLPEIAAIVSSFLQSCEDTTAKDTPG